jgi:aspartyl protease family protein
MLAWITLLIAALAGLLALFQSNAERLQAVPGLPVAIAVIAGLTLLYLLTLRKGADKERRGLTRIGAALASLAAIAAAIPILKATDLWPLAPMTIAESHAPATENSASGPSSVRVRRSADGRFSVRGDINGAALQLVVDTGAASIMLKASDAEAAGVDVGRLAFDAAVETANGATYVAPVRLRTVSVGPVRLDDVEGFVAKPGSLNENLLGMSFLRRLASYDLSGEFITLRQ